MREAFGFLLCLAIGGVGTAAAGRDRSPIIITAPAQFERGGYWISLTISNANHDYQVGLVTYPGSLLLESNRVYTFTIIEEPLRRGLLKKDLLIPHLARIEQDGKTIYDREVCETHHIRMERKEVRVLYGLIRLGPGEPTPDIEFRLFPHRREVVLGGCCVDRDWKTENIYVCSECKKAYAKWKANNAGTP